MKKLLLFLARLLLVSVVFIPVLPWFHEGYRFVLALLTTAAVPTREVMETLIYDGSSNLYTFWVLMLGTPGIDAKKRVIAISTGCVLFLSADFFMTAIWPHLKTPQPSLVNMAVAYGWLVVAHYLLPFVLWFGFAFREIESLFMGEGGAGSRNPTVPDGAPRRQVRPV